MVALGVGARFGLTGKLLPVGLLLGGSMASCQTTRRHSDDKGVVIATRRKLKPTHAERTVFGEGDGCRLAVHATSLGRMGALNCAEHIHTLTKYAMFSQNEQVHTAAWPSFSVCRDAAFQLSAQAQHPTTNNDHVASFGHGP